MALPWRWRIRVDHDEGEEIASTGQLENVT